MLLKKVNLIDDRGLYVSDEILQIPETVEEARSLNFPIVVRQERKNPDDLPEPQELRELKVQLHTLRAIAGDNERLLEACDAISNRIAELDAQWEEQKERSQWIEVEEFQIPPLAANQVEELVPQDGLLHHPKWDGFRWIEGLTAEEITAKNPKPADWKGFALALASSDLNFVFSEVPVYSWLQTALMTENEAAIATFWNQCLDSLAEELTDEQIKTLKAIGKKSSVPIDDNGAIATPLAS